MLLNILCSICPMHLQSLKKLFPTVLGEMHLQDIFDLKLTKGEGNIKHCPSTLYDVCTCTV